MGVARMVAGWNGKFDIRVCIVSNPTSQNPTYTFSDWKAYAVRRWSISGEAPPLPVPNTEGFAGHPEATDAEGYMASLTGLRVAKISLASATYDARQNLFGTPITVREGDFIQLRFYPLGRNGGKTITFTGVKVTSKKSEGEADGLQPITIEGESDGLYTFE